MFICEREKEREREADRQTEREREDIGRERLCVKILTFLENVSFLRLEAIYNCRRNV